MQKKKIKVIIGLLAAVILAGGLPMPKAHAQEAVPVVAVVGTEPEIVEIAPVTDELIPDEEIFLPEVDIPIEEISAGPLYAAADMADVTIKVKFNQREARASLAAINDFRTGSEAWYYTDDTRTNKTTVPGLDTLTYDYDLEKIAMVRAVEALFNMDSGHTRPDGTSYVTAYSGTSFSAIGGGENVLGNYSSREDFTFEDMTREEYHEAQQASGRPDYNDFYTGAESVESFKETEFGYSGQGHRRNMLRANWKSVGVACVEYNGTQIYVQEFSTQVKNASATAEENAYVNRTVALPRSWMSMEVEFEDGSSVIKAEKNKAKELEVNPYLRVVSGIAGGRTMVRYVTPVSPAISVTAGISDTSVAGITASGRALTLTGVKTGSTKLNVTASWNNLFSKTAARDVTVVDADVYMTSIDITAPSGREVAVGETLQLKAVISPSNATYKTVKWTSDDPTIAKVNQNGVVTGVKEGTTGISITHEEPRGSGKRTTTRGMSITVKKGGTWKKSNGKWWYRNADGTYPKNAWKQIGGEWYRFDASGYMVTGWKKISGKWYYFNASGIMQTGWKKVGGKWYYFNGSGIMQTGWVKVSGKWYYMNGSGAMITGWKRISGNWYYFESSGAMLANTSKKIGNKTYTFNAGGVCTNP